MVESVRLTRQGWIKHLQMLQGMLELVGDITVNMETAFPAADCEEDRRRKILLAMTKLRELVWESGAVSERIHRERGDKDPDFDALDRDMCNEATEAALSRLWDAARELERCARSLWDEDAPEVVAPEVVYPGPIGRQPPGDDPNQPLLGLAPAAPDAPAIDYKMRQANDDTTTPDPEGDGE